MFSGGSSVGERDLVLDAIRARGEVIFHGIAVKPGKPTAFGRISGTPVLGMPGYPTSCLSNAYMLLVPMLRKMARLPACSRAPSRAARPPHRVHHRPAPVLHGPPRGRRSAYRPSRLPATSPACRTPTATSRSPHTSTSSRRASRGREVVLMHQSTLTRAPEFSLPDQKGRARTLTSCSRMAACS